MKKICYVVASPMTAKALLVYQVNAIANTNQVCMVVNTDSGLNIELDFPRVRIVHLPIVRRISLWYDVKALFLLFRFLKSSKFDLVHSITPKAGLLAMLAARFARVPIRLHTFTGQVWTTRTGFFRWLLKSMDKIIFRCATRVLVDGFLQREFLLHENVVTAERSSVLGNGSLSGVDTARFVPNQAARNRIRHRYEIPENATLFLYLGRLNIEKGIHELCDAFQRIATEFDNVYLALIGPDEGGLQARIAQLPREVLRRVRREGFTAVPEEFLAAADVLCLPSHREGFATVINEAAAVGIPALGSNIYGISDAMLEGKTGILHEKCNVESLVHAMKQFVSTPSLAHQMGAIARERARKDFSADYLVKELTDYYERLSAGSKTCTAIQPCS